MALPFSLISLAAVLLGAHFLRAGNIALVALCLAAPALLFWKNRWSLILLQALAYAAALTWVAAAVQLVQMRRQLGLPWTTAVVILGSVALLTAIAGMLLNSRALRERYPWKQLKPEAEADPDRPANS